MHVGTRSNSTASHSLHLQALHDYRTLPMMH